MDAGYISLGIRFDEQSLNNEISKLGQRARQIKFDICPEFCKDAFHYKIDDRPLQQFEQSINQLTKRLQAQTLALNLKLNTRQADQQLLNLIGQQNDRTITIRTRDGSNQRTGYQLQTKEIVLGLQRVEKAVRDSGKGRGLLGNVITGFQEQIGANLNRQISAGVRDVFGKDTGSSARKVTKSASKFVKTTFFDNDEFIRASNQAQNILGDRLRKGAYKFGDGLVAAIDDKQGDITSKFNKAVEAGTKGVDFSAVGVALKQEIKESFDLIKGGIFNKGSLQKVMQPVGESLTNYRVQALEERAIPLVKERALEILNQKRTKNSAKLVNNDTQELIIASGGYAGARGLSGARLAQEFNKQGVEGRQAIWIKNSDSDIPKESMGKASDKLQALLGSIAKPNLRGYSNDSLEMAAQGLAAREINPNITIKLLGESGGGFVAEEASKILDMLGVKNEFLGVGTPNFIGRLDNKDRKIISPDEVLGAETNKVYARLGLANITPAQSIKGVTGHPYENYRDKGIAELQNFLQGNPGDTSPEMIGDFKQGAEYFKKQDKSKLDSRQIEQLAGAAFQNLQHIRRYMLVATGDTRKELESIVADFESIFVELSPDTKDISEAKQSIAKAQEYLVYLRQQPGIQAGIVANQVVKDLEVLKKSIQQSTKQTTGTQEQKYKAIVQSIQSTQQQLGDPAIGVKLPFNKKRADFQKRKDILGAGALQRVDTVDFSVLTKKETVGIPTQEIVSKVSETEQQLQQLAEQEMKIRVATVIERVEKFQETYKQQFKEALTRAKKTGDRVPLRQIGLNLLDFYGDTFAQIDELRLQSEPNSESNNILQQRLGVITRTKNTVERDLKVQKVNIPDATTARLAKVEEIKAARKQGDKSLIPLPKATPVEFVNVPESKKQSQEIGKNIVEGVVEGIGVALPDLNNIVGDIPEVIINRIKDDLDIQSPSKVMVEIGQFIVEGLKKGLSATGLDTVFSKLINVGKLSLLATGAIAIWQNFGEQAVQTARELESIEVKFDFATGSLEKARNDLSFVREESNRLGLSFKDTASDFANLAASTKGGSLEGFATKQIFTGVQEAGAVRQLSNEDIKGVNVAIQQIKDKGTVQREELVGQLGERLSGSLQLAARSRGQSVSEFNRDTQRGLVSSDEFLPGFSQALSAEASLALPKAVNSSSAVLNRFENEVLELQATFGKPLLSIQNTGLQALTAVIDILNKSMPLLGSALGVHLIGNFSKLLPELSLVTKEFFQFGKSSGKGLISNFANLSGAVSGFAAKTVLLLGFVEALMALQRALSSASGELNTFATSSEDGLKKYRDTLSDSVGIPTGKSGNITRLKDLNALQNDQTGELILPESSIGQGLLGFLPDRLKATDEGIKRYAFGLRGALQDLESKFGNFAEKAKQERVEDGTRIIEASQETNQEIGKAINGSFIVEQARVKKGLADLSNKRRAIAITNPGDEQGLRQIREEESSLLKAQDAISKPTLVLSQQNANTIEVLKKSIETFDNLAAKPSEYQAEYRKQATELRQQLEQAEKAQTSLNRAIKQGLNNITLFAQNIEKASAAFKDFRANNQLIQGNLNTQIFNFDPRTISSEQQQGIQRQAEIQLKSNELTQLQSTLAQLGQLISEQQGVLQPYGINQNTGVNEAQRILEQIGNDPSAGDAKLVLEKFVEYKQLQEQLPQLSAEIAQSQTEFNRSLLENGKAITTFYRELTNNAETLTIETKQIQNSSQITNSKSKLKQALVGNRDSFVSQYVDGLIGLIEALNKPLENALAAQQQIIQAQQQRVQQQLQLNDLNKQSPIILNGNVTTNDPNSQYKQNSVGIPTGNVGNIRGAIASPSTTQSLQQVLNGSVSRGQGFFGKRARGNHTSIDFDSTEGLGGHSNFQAMFPGQVRTTTAWGRGYTDRMGGENSNAIRIATPLSNGMEFLTDYGHYETPSARVKQGQVVDAGQLLGRLAGNDTGSQGGHLDVKIRIPSAIASNFSTTQPDPRNPGMVFVEVKQFMRWYQQNQVGKGASGKGASGNRPTLPTKKSDKRAMNQIGATGDAPDNLIDFVKGFEGFNPNAYYDYGHYSIGYGTPAKSPNERGISKEQGHQRLVSRLNQSRSLVQKEVGRGDLNEGQMDALTSLSFNAGSLKQFPKLLGNVRSGNWQGAANEFLDINKAKGKVLPGLTRRRKAEAEMFLSASRGNGSRNNSVGIPTAKSGNLGQQITPNQSAQSFSNTFTAEIQQSNSQLLANSQQQEQNIRAKLAADNQLAKLDAEISRTKLRNQFDEGLQSAEVQANQASRGNQNLRDSIGFQTPNRQRDTEIRNVNREFVDGTRDLTKQLSELQSARTTLAATRKLIESGGFPQLQGELPQINDGIKRLDNSIDIVSSALEQSSKIRQDRIKDIDTKFEIETKKRDQEFSSTSARSRANLLRQRADYVDQFQSGNVGDLSQGDPIAMRQQAANLESIANLNDQIIQLEELERTGQRTTEQIAKLRLQYEQLTKIELDIASLTQQRGLSERVLKIEARDLQKERALLDFDQQRNGLLAARIELQQRERPGDLTLPSTNRLQLQQQLSSGDLELREQINQLRQVGFEQNIPNEAIEKQIDNLRELDGLKLDNIRRELRLTLVEQLRGVREQRNGISDKLFESDLSVMQARSDKQKSFGVSNSPLDAQIAIAQQEQSYTQGMRVIEDYARSVNLSSEAVQQLKDNLSQLNELKLESIRDQFDPLQQVATSAIGGMQSGIEGLLNGTKSFGEAWATFTDSISNTLAKLAAEWLTNEFVTNILGIGKAKTPSFGGFGMESESGFGDILGGLLGGGSGLFGSILGFADGGGIPELNHKAYRALPVIGEALKKEGSNAVLIAATPGEYMLNIDESRAYKQMFPNGIKGFRSGGEVGSGVRNMAQSVVSKGGNTNNVNISVSNVNNGSAEIDVKSLRRVIVAEITRQQEFGGVSSKVG